MEHNLSAEQCRVIGVLLEKEVTTPEQYPLSLNSLTSACNQKSNRDPVLQLTEAAVQDLVEQLKQAHIVADAPMSGRVDRYQHRFCNTPFGGLQLSEQERAISCLLLLRGPQTPGELRTRCQRLASFSSVNELEQCLQGMQQHQTGPLVKKLEREPGKRDSRYVHLFSGDVIDSQPDSSVADPVDTQSLQAQVDQLRSELDELKQKFAELTEDKSAWLQ